MLPKKHRLTSEKDFQTIYRYGTKYRGKYGMLIALPPRDSAEISSGLSQQNAQVQGDSESVTHETVNSPQFGFVVSKKIGNAVIRHKMTRWLRNIVIEYMKNNPEFGSGYKFSFVAYEMPDEFAVFKEELPALLGRIAK